MTLKPLPLFLFCLLALSSLMTLYVGEMPFPEALSDLWLRLLGTDSKWNPILDERLPRLIVLICSGGSLAVSGAIMQSLFHNPLASPGVLGITSGGSLAVLFVFLSGLYVAFPLAIPLAAILGSLLTLMLVTALAKMAAPSHSSQLILIGIAISTLFIATHSALLYCFRDHWTFVQMMTEWQAGSTHNRNWDHAHMQAPLTLVGLYFAFTYRKEMNLLALGDEEALSLGVDVGSVKWRLFLAATLLSAGSLAGAGSIAFFGLVLPHLARTLNGPSHETLIPLCCLGGGALLPTLDVAMRLLHLQFLTIGNISGVIGGLFFFALLARTQKKRAYA